MTSLFHSKSPGKPTGSPRVCAHVCVETGAEKKSVHASIRLETETAGVLLPGVSD